MKDYNYPNEKGYFDEYGGKFVAETLMPVINELKAAWNEAKNDPSFWEELNYYHQQYTGRPSPLYFAERLTDHVGGAKIYLKREDLNHTGAHKINHCIGQVLLAKRMGKKLIVAETGAGQHGVATATVAALFGFPCTVFQGSMDIARQAPNALRMKMLGAKLEPVEIGTKTLKDATTAAMQYWVSNAKDTYYILGSAVGPDPYPEMVKSFQRIIGDETKQQILEQEKRLPDAIVACVGGGSNAIGMFAPFIEEENVKLFGAEAGGKGLNTEHHASTITTGKKGVFHGMKSYFMQDDDGQIIEPYSISAGLDYPGVGPEHAMLHDTKRATYETITDAEALEAFRLMCSKEGIIPALESSHAVALGMKVAKNMNKDEILVINLSGRGDKDIDAIAQLEGEDNE